MIKSVQFKNFKALRDAELPLGRFTLLVGPNGSGKSTALRALVALSQPNSVRFDEFATAGVAPSAIELRVNWGEPYDGALTTITWRQVTREGPQHTGYHVELEAFLTGVRFFALNANAIAEPARLQPHVALQENGSYLAVVLDRLRDEHPERFAALNATLGQWLPEFDAVLFDTPDAGNRAFALRTRKGHHVIPARSISDGTRLALAMLTLAYLPDSPSVVCLEEPDHGIHPRLLRDVRDALYRLSYPEQFGEDRKPVCVVATTHSPYLLDLFRDHPEEVVIAQKVGLEARFERLSDRPDIDEILADSHLGEVWYSGVLGGVTD